MNEEENVERNVYPTSYYTTVKPYHFVCAMILCLRKLTSYPQMSNS